MPHSPRWYQDRLWIVNSGTVVKELYDVVVLPGIKRPMAIGLKSDEIRRVISIED